MNRVSIRCFALVALVACALTSTPAVPGDREWTVIAPTGGKATAFFEGHAGLYMISNTRLYLSEDRGSTWSLVAAFDERILSGAADGDTLILGITGVDLVRSTDGGATWTGIELSGGAISHVFAIGVSAPGVVFAGAAVFPDDTASSLYRSVDGGLTWQSVPAPGRVLAIATDPTNPSVVFIGHESGLMRSLDGGDSWTALQVGTFGGKRISSIAVSADGQRIVVGSDEEFNFAFRSLDGGTTWGPVVFTADYQHVVEGLAYDFADPGRFFGALSSTTSSATQPRMRLHATLAPGMSAGLAHFDAKHPPEPTAFHRLEGAVPRLIVGSTRGVFVSEDDGASWTPANSGFDNAAVSSFHVSSATPDTLFATSRGDTLVNGQEAVYRSDDGGESWSIILGDLATNGTGFDIIVGHPVDADRALVARSLGLGLPLVHMTSDGGVSWPGDPGTAAIGSLGPALSYNHENPDTAYMVERGGTLHRTMNGGADWSHYSSDLADRLPAGSVVYDHVVSPVNADIHYAATTDGVYRSDDSGLTWERRMAGGPSGLALPVVADPNHLDTVYAVVNFVLYRSVDAGASWTAVLNQAVISIAVDPNDSQRMIALSWQPHIRALGSVDGGTTWVELSDGMDDWGSHGGGVDAHWQSIAFDPHESRRYYASVRNVLQVYEGSIATDLGVTASMTPGSVEIGGSFELAFDLEVVAGDPATGVELTLNVPVALDIDEVIISVGNCGTARPIVCSVGMVSPGDLVSGTVALVGASAGTGEVTLSVSAVEQDMDPANDQTVLSYAVTSPPPPPAPPAPPAQNPPRSGGGSAGWVWLLALAAMVGIRQVSPVVARPPRPASPQ